jgi:hypothetical protein
MPPFPMPEHPGPGWGYWQAMNAAQAMANANLAAQSTAAWQQQTMVATQTRASLLASVQAHLAAVQVDVAANPDAVAHLSAASQILASLP